MPGIPDLADLCSSIEESARLLDIACSRDKIWPILTAYGDVIAEDTVIAFRVATDARNADELDCRFTISKDVDPYAIALSNGLIAGTDHPIGTLIPDTRERCPIDCYGIDFGVVGGFKKTWAFFPPDDLQGLSRLAGIPSMPRSVAENASFLAGHGLDGKVSLTGIDYHHKTVNLYFGDLPAECLEPKTIISMLREIGLPDPSEQMLKLAPQAFGIYPTLTWDSSKIERITFAVMTLDPTELPIRLEPKIEQFVRSVPYAAASRRFVYAVSLSPDGEYYKLQSYYQWRPRILDNMLVSGHAEEPACGSARPHRAC